MPTSLQALAVKGGMPANMSSDIAACQLFILHAVPAERGKLRPKTSCRFWLLQSYPLKHLHGFEICCTLAGGGYTKNNVSRCWTAETAVLVDQNIADELPPNDYYEYYAPNYR